VLSLFDSKHRALRVADIWPHLTDRHIFYQCQGLFNELRDQDSGQNNFEPWCQPPMTSD